MVSISNLTVSTHSKKIISDFSLNLPAGSLSILMGPNGSGKSSLANALIGHPAYEVQSGEIVFNRIAITADLMHDRVKKGLFLAFQNPPVIPGLEVLTLLKESVRAVRGITEESADLKNEIILACQAVGLNESFLYRATNEGFSGGEKKRLEMLQMQLLKPKVAILDEIDSGLDVDALKKVVACLTQMRISNPSLTILLITHYGRIIEHLAPDFVHVMSGGRLIASGGSDLIRVIETEGYDAFNSRL